ncbi:MAG: HlyD family efflux transporter periplasmic adaptor subunit [Planctomycetota bacterium]|nr:MAG: HlyD family efflux transporter periplasmic adaptor subunit [Planctomycetota bacterium]REK18129.1 MAG: HlyD family efflux transporter periplasmic adaptor subunit [Planctomycetota bacterium]REK44202.1 MAG: HlyD family efflux transporter periplasmic adaptor subunit [Planctomycetota bacterium]
MPGTTAEANRRTLGEIRAELATLVASDLGPDAFFRNYLGLLCESTGAVGAGAWGLSREGVLVQLGAAGSRPDSGGQTEQRQLVHQLLAVLHSGQPQFQTPRLFVPVLQERSCIGVLELLFPEATSGPDAQQTLPIAKELSFFVAEFMARQVRQPSPDHAAEPTGQLEAFALRLARDTSSLEVATTAVNEGRRILGCDRVSLAVRRGKSAQLLAVSGQERVQRRSNLVRALTEIASHVLHSGRPLRYAGVLDGLPPAQEAALVEYLAESGARSLEVIPLRPPTADSRSKRDEDSGSPPLGVLVVEQLTESQPTAAPAALERLGKHVAQALAKARQQEQIFLLPLWRALGSQLGSKENSESSRVGWLAALALAAVTFVGLLPVPYRVEGEGRLVPAQQRRVFATRDAEVVEVYCRGGQRVEAGQPLLRLHDDDLAMRLLLVRNELQEQEQALAALQAESDEGRGSLSREAEIRQRGRISHTSLEIEGLRLRLAALEQQQDDLTIDAPISGTLATFEPARLLAGRPVGRGELLLEVMDESGPWRLEVDVPAHRLGHLQRARDTLGEEALPVRYVLATLPERTLEGTLTEMSTRAVVGEDGATVIPLNMSVDDSQIDAPAVGAEVSARIDCGRKCFAYVLFGDLYEFLRRRVW